MPLTLGDIRGDFSLYAGLFLKVRSWDLTIQPLKFNPNQQIIHARVMEQMKQGLPVRLIILKGRQLGSSTYCQGYGFWRSQSPLTTCMTLAHDLDSTAKIFNMAKFFFDNLPPDMRPMKRYSNRKELVWENPDERTRDTNPGLRSSIEIKTAGNIGSGKGLTVNVLHVSEVAVFRQPELIASALFPAVPPTAESAIFLESTAHLLGYWFHEQWDMAKDGQSPFIPVFLPWYLEARYELHSRAREVYLDRGPRSDHEDALIREFGLTLGHIAFRRHKIEELGSEDLFRQEYPMTDEEAWITVGSPLIPIDVIRRLDADSVPGMMGDYVGPQVGFMPNKHGRLMIWEPPKDGMRYTIGVDTSQGNEGSDPSSVQVLTSSPQQVQVAAWHGVIDPIALAPVIADLARWYNVAMVTVETNPAGGGIITQKALLESGYTNLYLWRMLDKMGVGITERYGWYTSNSTKGPLVGTLRHMILSGKLVIRDPETVDELRTFVTNARGSAQAAPGKHDDRVMALAIASMSDTLAGGEAGWTHQTPSWQKQGEIKDPRTHDLMPGPWLDTRKDWRTM